VRPITGEIFVNAPVEEVFDFVADERNEPLYNANMLRAEKLTPGPVGIGTQFAAVMRGRGRTALTIECTGFNRPQALASLSRTAGMEIEGQLTFVPEGNGTRLRWVWRLHPQGALRVLTPLIRAMGNHQERANWSALKSYLEAARRTA
jgi:hypothetical protein